MSRSRGAVVFGVLGAAAVVLVIVLLNLRSPAPLRYRMDLSDRGTPLRTVTVYYLHPDSLVLVPQDREVMGGSSRRDQAAALIGYLSEGSGDLKPALPPGTRLLHFFDAGDGEVILDFSPQVDRGRSGGILVERLQLAALSRTMIENIEGVGRVRLLVLGRPLERWGSHLSPRTMLETGVP